MKHSLSNLLLLSCLLAGPVLAQTQIGGGTCNSSSLNGTYNFSLTGRQIGAAATFTGVYQANGSATFDGTNKVSLTMTASTLQGLGAAAPLSGTYTVQANCLGTIALTSGSSANLDLVAYNQGKAFLVVGSDATYAYTGSGGTQPAGCLPGMLSGVYTFNGTGYNLASGAVTGIRDASGLLQFDGHSILTVNLTASGVGQAPASLTLTGTYAVNAACTGTANVSDAQGNSYSLAFSVSAGNKFSTTTFDVLLTQPGKLTITGTGHAAYGQPTADATDRNRQTLRSGESA